MLTSNININQQSFGKMFSGENTKYVLKKPNCPKRLANEFVHIRRLLQKQGINKLQNVDMILDYSERNKDFMLEVLPKDKSYPRGEKSIFFERIVNREDVLAKLQEWAAYWNNKYAPHK